MLKTALERHDFDCTQMALNAALVGMKGSPKGMIPNPDMTSSFETVALPVARAKKMGIIAMKIFGQEALVGAAPTEKLLYYSLSLPVTTAVVGMPKLEHLEENVQAGPGLQAACRARRCGRCPRSCRRNTSSPSTTKLHHHHDHYA